MRSASTTRRRRRTVRSWLSSAVSVVVLAGATITVSQTVTAAHATPAEPSTPWLSESQRAAQTGDSVEVVSTTTPTSQVTANPDGSFSLEATTTPVRVERGGTWVDIDTNLHRDSDGTYSPNASAVPITFSGGGTGPAVIIGDGDVRVSLSWPGRLPDPEIKGNTATYSRVLPGVDLVLEAGADTYREVLVVRNPEAAANPTLSHLPLTLTANGLSIRNTATGISAADERGTEVFHGNPPVMWDSHIDTAIGDKPSAADPGSGDVTTVPLVLPAVDATDQQQSTTITLSPPGAALSGADVEFPLFIDPQLSPGAGQMAVVFSNAAPVYSTEDLRVGACPQSTDSTCNNIGTANSYIKFNIQDLTGKPTTAVISYAAVQVYQKHTSSGCTAKPTELHKSGDIGTFTTWEGPKDPTVLQTVSSSANDHCNNSAAYITFDNPNVLKSFQDLADIDYTRIAFALTAQNPTDESQWKRFSAVGTDSAPKILVRFDFPPSVPTSLTFDGAVACSGKPTYVRDSTPVSRATATDYNPSPGQVGLWFEIWNASGRARYNSSAVGATSGQAGGWASNSSNSNSTAALPDTAYNMRVRASTLSPDVTNQYSAWSSRTFTIDSVAPPTPTVASFDYPPLTWGAASADGGTFTVTAPNAVGVAWNFDTTSLTSPSDTECGYNVDIVGKHYLPVTGGTATIDVAANRIAAGRHTLSVRSFDDAHNLSPITTYTIYVAPTFNPRGQSKFEAELFTPLPPQTARQAGKFSQVVPNRTVASFADDSGPAESAGQRRQIISRQPGDGLDFNFTVPINADYAIGAQLTKDLHNGIVKFQLDGNDLQVNGQASTLTTDTYGPSSSVHIVLGGVYLEANGTDGQQKVHWLRVVATGKNDLSQPYTYAGNNAGVSDNGYSIGLDYFRVVPINNYTITCGATATVAQCLSSGFNNNGFTDNGHADADVAPIGTNYYGISRQLLASAGMGPGMTVIDNGATFTMPQPNAAGDDNMIASGQRIQFGTKPSGRYFDMLTVSTCGRTVTASTRQLTFGFGDDIGITNSPLPDVPDWNVPGAAPSAPPDTYVYLAKTLAYRNIGTSTESAFPVYIYHVRVQLPSYRDYQNIPLLSVTLPNTGSSFNCVTPSLHILAVTMSG